ncbi:hypothetical protein IV102_02855 [bacterium]|nr:hypothetical protein [bacterium]
MRSLLEKLRRLYPALPVGASAEDLRRLEEILERRLPGALRGLYQDHNGEPHGLPVYRLLPLHDAYPISESVWCFWENRYDPTGEGADYRFADGTVVCDDRTFPSVQAFLEDLIDSTTSMVVEKEAPPLPEVFARAEKLDGLERRAALIGGLSETTAEFAPRLLSYLQDDDEVVVVATCEWIAVQRITQAIWNLAQVATGGGSPARQAARRTLETLGGEIFEYKVQMPVRPDLEKLVNDWFGDKAEGAITVLKRSPNAEWEAISAQYVQAAGPSLPLSARERPGMYFGSTNGSGAQYAALEIIANSVDQVLQGLAHHVRVRLDEWSLEVEDDGEGYPLDSELGELYLTQFHNSPTVDQHAPHVHLVTQGVGLAPVNAVCSDYQVQSVRGGQGYQASFRCGELVGKERVTLDFTRGTRVRLSLDRSIWQCGFQVGPLRRQLFDFVHLIPGLVLTLNDERFHAPRGLLDLAEFATDWTGDRSFGFRGQTDFLMLQVAAKGECSRRMHIESWVNGARTEEHGSHVGGALEAFQEIGWRPARLLVHVIMREPRYAGPVRRRLQVPKALRQVRELLRRELAQER